jgi:hypothetical protein
VERIALDFVLVHRWFDGSMCILGEWKFNMKAVWWINVKKCELDAAAAALPWSKNSTRI